MTRTPYPTTLKIYRMRGRRKRKVGKVMREREEELLQIFRRIGTRGWFENLRKIVRGLTRTNDEVAWYE